MSPKACHTKGKYMNGGPRPRSPVATLHRQALLLLCLGGAFLLTSCIPSFDWNVEFKDIGYQKYTREFDTSDCGPVGASHIYVKSVGTRDTSDTWLRLAMSPNDFQDYLKVHKERHAKDMSVTIRTPSMAGIPFDWPRAAEIPPAWWQLPGIDEDADVTVWECRDEVNPWGEYWHYDGKQETLWTFEWHHQWGEFGMTAADPFPLEPLVD